MRRSHASLAVPAMALCLLSATLAVAENIDPDSDDSQYAYAENVGWITFASSGLIPYGVKTSWLASPPTGSSTFLGVEKDGDDLVLNWSSLPSAEFYEVISGALNDLASSGGDFSLAVDDCASNVEETSFTLPLADGSHDDFFLVRGVNCGGKGTVDSGGSARSACAMVKWLPPRMTASETSD